MISRMELEAVGRSLGFTAYQAEKDYLQHAFLSSLYVVSTNEFVFKGGTALQKVFNLDRFSEDLDFTFHGEGAGQFIERAVDDLERFTEAWISNKKEKASSFSTKIKVRGPLYGGTELSVQTIRIDVSLRERVLDVPLARRVVPLYADLRPYVALCMSVDEMFAEKIRAILTREKPRDVYDVWFLCKRKALFNQEKTDAKLAFYGRQFRFAEFEKALKDKQRLWEREMGTLLRIVPPFGDLCREILQSMKRDAC